MGRDQTAEHNLYLYYLWAPWGLLLRTGATARIQPQVLLSDSVYISWITTEGVEDIMRDDKHKTLVDRDRLAWWGAEADEAFWHGQFSPVIEQQHQSISKGVLPKYIQKLIKFLPKDGKMLEAGCGTGWLVSALLAKGYDVEGVDSSNHLIDEVLKLYPRLPVRTEDVLNLRVPDESYAGYLSLGVIEHRIHGCEPFLREAYRVLRPGGIACIAVPHFNALRLLKARLHFYAPTPPPGTKFYQYAFTKRYFQKVLTTSGFNILTFYTSGAQYCIPEELGPLFGRLLKAPGVWRLHLRRYAHYFDALDFTQMVSHMIFAVAQKPM